MAKKKSTEPADAIAPEVTKVEIPIEETPEAPTAEDVQPAPTEPEQANEPVSDDEATEPKDDAAPEQAPVAEAEEPATPVIPDKALAYLRRHPEDKEVYIDKFGGVFPASTPKAFVKEAVLYQNPFYK